MDLLTFDEALAEAGDDVSVLLGNGFSQAYDRTIFNYRSLLDNASFGIRDKNIKNIFKEFDTYDFEKVMSSLEHTEKVSRIYNADQLFIECIIDDQVHLKNSLIRAITDTHPNRSSDVPDVSYEYAKDFALNFKNIFTLNYDLLIYWVINKLSSSRRFDDGFRYDDGWTSPEYQNIFFVHGALHLYEDTAGDTMKHIFREIYDSSIIDAVSGNLESNKFPLFVSEPSSVKKLNKIKKSPYLTNCYNSLANLAGSLFIYGHSMDENDAHIFIQLAKSDINKIYISIFGDANSESNLDLMYRTAKYFRGKDIFFYSAQSTPIWNGV
ncbi:TPA: DUF4917 family protein [Morganella morganii subsp. morganii]|nr:DUF4917 family protein [Morganella morganii subsp. morganii]